MSEYKNIPAAELRELCAFKDGTIEILQRVLTNTDAALREVQKELADLHAKSDDWEVQA